MLKYGFAIVGTVAIGTTAVAAGALWSLYKVTLGRFGTKSQGEVDDVTAGGKRPDPDGKFFTKRDGGGLKYELVWSLACFEVVLSNGFSKVVF